MANVSVAVIVTDAVKAVANTAIEAMGWHPTAADSFYLAASPDGEVPITHWYLRAQASPGNATLIEAIAAAQWPDPTVIGAPSWESVGLDSSARAALSAGLDVDIRTEAELAANGWEYAGHMSGVLMASGLVSGGESAP